MSFSAAFAPSDVAVTAAGSAEAEMEGKETLQLPLGLTTPDANATVLPPRETATATLMPGTPKPHSEALECSSTAPSVNVFAKRKGSAAAMFIRSGSISTTADAARRSCQPDRVAIAPTPVAPLPGHCQRHADTRRALTLRWKIWKLLGPRRATIIKRILW